MGNKMTENGPGTLLEQINQHYEKVAQDTRGLVLLDKKTQNNYLLKEYTFCSQTQYQSKKKELQELVKAGPKEYVISPVRIQSSIFSSFCSTSYKIYAIFEYPQVTLKEQISARQKENNSFEEDELWSILQSCTNALSELKPLVSLNCNQIFINPDGQLKIIHDDLLDENYRAVMDDQIHYAPQKIKNFNKIDTDLGLRKQSIFSMGMTLLEAAILDSVSSCYDYINCNFSQTCLNQMLSQLSTRYSPEFIQTLSNIVETNPNRRASLMQVQKMLQNFWSAEQTNYFEQSKQNQSISQKKIQTQRSQQYKKQQETPLNQKSFNSSRPVNNEQKQKVPVGRPSKTKQRQATIPDQLPSFKLQKPRQDEGLLLMTTPKNQVTLKQNNLYTDPKLLEMIKKDLEDIGKLKQSAFCQTSKYTYMYPQTQSILNSIRNFDTQSKVQIAQSITTQIQPFNNTQPIEIVQRHADFSKKSLESSLMRPTMKKKSIELIFTVQTYQNGRRYQGTTLKGRKHGKGKLMFQDGAYYQGEFFEDRMNGKGTLYYCQKYPAYQGQWVNDQFQGKGILYNQNPQPLNIEYDFSNMQQVEEYWIKYEGEFIQDNKSGRGKLYLTNGQIFDGEFYEDCANGKGRYHCLNGEVIEGIWRQNLLSEVFRSQ